MDEDEVPLYMLLPGEAYAGSLLIAFRNGKVARIPVSSYETKTRRKKLVKAFSDVSPVVGFGLLRTPEEEAALNESTEGAPTTRDFFLLSDTNKAILFSADLIPEKVTRNTQGVQVLSGKRRGTVCAFRPLTAVTVENPEYYRIRKIPNVGYYLKEETLAYRQIRLSEAGATGDEG
jgi:DNA gyrase subunit A